MCRSAKISCCKGLKVCLNGRIFLAGVVMNSAKTVGQKVGGGLVPTGPIGVYAYASSPSGQSYKYRIVTVMVA